MSLPDRLDALERWETAWREMDLSNPIAVIDAPPDSSESFVDCFKQHVVACHTTGFDDSKSASYSFFDLSTWPPSPTDVMRWTTIYIPNRNVLSFTFAPELNLSVAFSYVKMSLSHTGLHSIRIA
jgi:hypothetical protein